MIKGQHRRRRERIYAIYNNSGCRPCLCIRIFRRRSLSDVRAACARLLYPLFSSPCLPRTPSRSLADRSGEVEEIVRTHLFDRVHGHPRRLANRFDDKVQLLGQRLFLLPWPSFIGFLDRLLDLLLDLP